MVYNNVKVVVDFQACRLMQRTVRKKVQHQNKSPEKTERERERGRLGAAGGQTGPTRVGPGRWGLPVPSGCAHFGNVEQTRHTNASGDVARDCFGDRHGTGGLGQVLPRGAAGTTAHSRFELADVLDPARIGRDPVEEGVLLVQQEQLEVADADCAAVPSLAGGGVPASVHAHQNLSAR